MNAMSAAAFTFEAIGSRWQIDVYDYPQTLEGSLLLDKIKARCETYDRTYSRFRADSFVTEMSRTAGDYTLPPDGQALLDLYHDFYDLTNGVVTPLIGHVLVEAGYDATYSLVPGVLHHPPTWNEALDYNFPRLTIKKPVLLDVGAFGKGHLIDIIAEILFVHGIRSFCIDAGGDIRHTHERGESIQIGLENPLDTSQAIGIATITNKSICGSAGNRRAWDRFHHIIDPRTLESPRHILATWAIADTTILADALATSLFFASPAELSAHYRFEYVIMYADGSAARSPGFPGELFT